MVNVCMFEYLGFVFPHFHPLTFSAWVLKFPLNKLGHQTPFSRLLSPAQIEMQIPQIHQSLISTLDL